MADSEFLPWHRALHERLVKMHETDRLPHALLLGGPRHVGKRHFALAAAAYFLCQRPDKGRQCGECDNCLLLRAGTHPDFRRIFPEERKNGKSTGVMNERKLIVIEQIRHMIDWSGQTAQRGGMKAVVIHPAEQMNLNAANALLKCLEEPTANTVIILVSDQPGRLLPTIRSRCQHFDFAMPTAAESLPWLTRADPSRSESDFELLLSISGGAPLAALEVYDDDYLGRRREVARALEQLSRGGNPLDVAKPFARSDAIIDLSILESLLADAVRIAVGGGENLIKNKDLQPVLGRLQSSLSPRDMLRCIELVGRERRSAAGPSNPNVALLFEALFVDIASMSRL